jgi:hypothetical protein
MDETRRGCPDVNHYENTSAAPMSRATQLVAPLAVPCMGSNSVLSTPAFDGIVADSTHAARVRDGKQAAPPRGELR